MSLRGVKDAEFESKVVRAPRPAAVKFTAEWCPGCRTLEPVIEELATQYAGRIDIYEMDTDENPETPSSLGVTAIPLTVFYKGGREAGRILGGTKQKLEDLIKQLV